VGVAKGSHDRVCLLTDHGCVPERRMIVPLVRREVLLFALGECEFRQGAGRDQRRYAGDQPPSREFRHN
jgi:hypothetical protein